MREKWFKDFIQNKKNLDEVMLRHFHGNTESNNTENGLVINRDNQVKTFSITQAVLDNGNIQFVHDDLLNNVGYSEILKSGNTMPRIVK